MFYVFFVPFTLYMLLFLLICTFFWLNFLCTTYLYVMCNVSLTIFSLFCFSSSSYNWTIFSRLLFSDVRPLGLGSSNWIRSNQLSFLEQTINTCSFLIPRLCSCHQLTEWGGIQGFRGKQNYDLEGSWGSRWLCRARLPWGSVPSVI